MKTQITITHLTDAPAQSPASARAIERHGCSRQPPRNRRDATSGVLDRIVADLEAQAPDHIAVTGDLANIGLPQEHIKAGSVESLGAASTR
jgi:3',5'-cyclic AMP phosphodiesterase CpdA